MEREADRPIPILQIDRKLITAEVAVSSVVCRAHASGCGGEEPVESPRIILPRRGLFLYHLHRLEFVADANSAFLLDAGDVCRVSHPVPGGDECTVLVPAPGLLEDAFGERRCLESSGSGCRFHLKRVESTPRIQMGLRVLQAILDTPEEALHAEEVTMRLLEALAQLSAGGPATRRPEPSAQMRYVERARAFLACSPGERHLLEAIGEAAHCSPFHLARHFRRATGLSLHQYQTGLRMALALDRLADGEEDISRLAVDLGFAHHSHFSARFREVFGIPPQEARNSLTRKNRAGMRRILTASGLP